MDDKNRKKFLVGGLITVVAVYLLRSTVDGIVMEPVRDLQKKLTAARDLGEDQATKLLELRSAQSKIAEWQQMSIPENPDDARRLYREWILELARQSGFGGTQFDVAAGARGQTGEINVDIKAAETDLAGLARFLYLFDQANLLHRIFSLNIDSQGTQGKPKLLVSLTAQAIHVRGDQEISERSELFPRTALAADIADKATEIIVKPSDEFAIPEPFEPFVVRIDRELVRVDEISDAGWRVTRGFNQTKGAAHSADAVVELFPIQWDRREVAIDRYQAFVDSSPFVIPSPPKNFNPRLSGVSDKTIKPGEELKFSARAESFDPEKGEAEFALEEPAEGMSIDPKSGEFIWKPADSIAPGKYTTTVLVTQSGNPDVKLNSKLIVTVKQPNAAPVVTLKDAATVIIGREFTVTASATDDGPVESVTWSTGNGTPEGLTIDAKSGVIKWTPAATFTPGKYDVEVKATDAGEEPKTASKKISLDVHDDAAALTMFTASIGKDGVPYAWFRNRGTDKTEKLKVGDMLNVSEINAELVEIAGRTVTLRDAEGLWKLSLGDLIRERKLIEPATTPATTDPVPTKNETYDTDPPAATQPE